MGSATNAGLIDLYDSLGMVGQEVAWDLCKDVDRDLRWSSEHDLGHSF